jgi:hypothetical protein
MISDKTLKLLDTATQQLDRINARITLLEQDPALAERARARATADAIADQVRAHEIVRERQRREEAQVRVPKDALMALSDQVLSGIKAAVRDPRTVRKGAHRMIKNKDETGAVRSVEWIGEE